MGSAEFFEPLILTVPLRAGAAVNEDFIHKLRRGIGRGLGNRFAQRMSWKLCAASSSASGAGLVVADFQREPSAEMPRRLRDETAKKVEAVGAAIERGERIVLDLAGERRDLAAGDVGEIGDDEIEVARRRRRADRFARKLHPLGEPEARRIFARQRQGVAAKYRPPRPAPPARPRRA